jgi:hypothetical protein
VRAAAERGAAATDELNMTGGRIGDIVLDKDGTSCRAFLRPADGAPETLLCTMDLGVYERHPVIRDLFVNLAGAIAVNHDQPAGSTVVVQQMSPQRPAEQQLDRSRFACWNCTRPQAIAARQWLNTYSDADLQAQLSPRGTPIFCCRIGSAAVMAR